MRKKIQIYGLPHRDGDGEGPFVKISYQGLQAVGTVPSALFPAGSDYLLSDLRWNLEDFATQDPFNAGAEDKMAKKVKRYSSTLIKFIANALEQPEDLLGSTVVIKLLDRWVGTSLPLATKDGANIVPLIQWECLEIVTLWPKKCRPEMVSVVRCTTCKDPPPERHRSLRGGNLTPRILALSARPYGDRDIPHRLVTRTIYQAVLGVELETRTAPELEIVRPGTLSGLKAALAAHNPGHFDIVHLDVHGIANKDSATLLFWDDTESGGAHHVQANELAKILREYHVQRVIMNACQSAALVNNFSRSLVQQGVPMVLGMQYKLLESAATILTRSLYRDLLERGRSFAEACSTARWELRYNPHRKTKYNTTVEVGDFLNPVLFIADGELEEEEEEEEEGPQIDNRDINEQQRRQSILLIAEPSTPSAIQPAGEEEVETTEVEEEANYGGRQDLVGRESDILNLENDLLAFSNLIFLSGNPGSGKSALANHLCWWWKATKLIDGVLWIDFASFKSVEWNEVVQDFCSQLENPTLIDEKSLSQYLQANRYLIIFDSVDELGSSTPPSFIKAIGAFTKPIRKVFRKSKKGSLFLFLGRDAKAAIRAATAAHVQHLDRLNVDSSLDFCLRILQSNIEDFGVTDLTSASHMEQIVLLLDGNPLAMELVMADFAMNSSHNICQYYRRLTSNKQMKVYGHSRAMDQVYRLINTAWENAPFNQKLLTQKPLVYLSPFWTVVPKNIASYWKFLELTAQRLETPKESHQGSMWVYGKAAEEMDHVEADFFYGQHPTPELGNAAELQEKDTQFGKMVESLSSTEFLGEILSKNFGPTATEENVFYKISPLLTICLRSMLSDYDAYDPDDAYLADHSPKIISVAFQRFYWRRYLLLWMDNNRDNFMDVATREILGKRAVFEFENWMTYIKFTYSVSLSQKVHHFVDGYVYDALARYQFRSKAIILLMMEEGVDFYLTELHRMPPSQVRLWTDKLNLFFQQTRQKITNYGNTDEAEELSIRPTVFSVAADHCVWMLGRLIEYASHLSRERGKYLAQVQEIKKLIHLGGRNESTEELAESLEKALNQLNPTGVSERLNKRFEEIRTQEASEEDTKKWVQNYKNPKPNKELEQYAWLNDLSDQQLKEILDSYNSDHKYASAELNKFDKTGLKILERTYKTQGSHPSPIQIIGMHNRLLIFALHIPEDGIPDVERAVEHYKVMKHHLPYLKENEEPWYTVSTTLKNIEAILLEIQDNDLVSYTLD